MSLDLLDVTDEVGVIAAVVAELGGVRPAVMMSTRSSAHGLLGSIIRRWCGVGSGRSLR